MADDGQADFFVSYTGADAAWAGWVSVVLKQAGYRVIVQEFDFGEGNFVALMEDAVRRADHVLPVLSEAYLRSDWAREEWTAFARERAIIPVQVTTVDSRSLLRQYTRVNLLGLDERSARDRLTAKLRRLAGPPLGQRQDHRPRADAPPFPGWSASTGSLQPKPPLARRPMPRREPISRGQLQLVVLGAGHRGAAGQLAGLFDTPAERVLDLHDSPLSVQDQRQSIAALLDGLAPGEVTDIVVAFVGRGTILPATGLQLQVAAADPAVPATALGLGLLLDDLAAHSGGRRAVLLVDVLDEKDQAPVLPDRWGDVPVLDLRGPSGGGLADLVGLLTGPPAALARVLHHRAALTISDLAALSGDAIHALADDPLDDVGLAPNPLAWPRHCPVGAGNWCVVLSTADAGHPERSVERAMQRLEGPHRRSLDKALRRSGRAVTLDEKAERIAADDVLTSPVALARAVEQVCLAEIAVFDLTNYEPAVMFLLGIRSVVRRGVTLCVHTGHADAVQAAETPFHIREISLLSQADPNVMVRRLLAGIRQRELPGRAYTDLPSFPLVRSVPPDPNGRGSRSFDRGGDVTILALVPFNARYEVSHWVELQGNVLDAAVDVLREESGEESGEDEPEPTVRIVRTFDLDSPRVVSAQLHEAVRLTDFCIVDLTAARPNVIFELGVRLVANPLHPVVVRDPDHPHPFADDDWSAAAQYQCDQLCGLLSALQYQPYVGPIAQYRAMIERYLALREFEIRPGDSPSNSVLDGFPPRAIYDIAWRHALADEEVVTIPVDERLEATADEFMLDERAGASHLIYPTWHPLSEEADRTGREYLVAAWLYLHFRRRSGASANVPERYQAMTQRLLLALEKSNDEADHAFARHVEELAGEVQGTPRMSGWRLARAEGHAAEARRLSARGAHARAEELHRLAVELCRKVYAEHTQDAKDGFADLEEQRRAVHALADHLGQLGGSLRRANRLDAALDAYREGAKLEQQWRLDDTYNRSNAIVLSAELHPKRMGTLASEVEEVLRIVRRLVEGPRREQSWAWSDLGLLSLLDGREEDAAWAYGRYLACKPREVNIQSTLDVLIRLRRAIAPFQHVTASTFGPAIERLETFLAA